MSARTLTYRTGLLSIGREIFYTLAQMGEEPLAASYLPIFQTHRDKWQTVLLAEIALLEAFSKAQAAVVRADRKLDAFVNRVDRSVKEIAHAPTRNQIKKKLFKGKPVARFRRPLLGRQLLDMQDWSQALAGCGVPELVALAPEAAQLYAAGKAASDLKTSAEAANRTFRDVGERKKFVDDLNASRKETDGALAKLPFKDPSLPQEFSDDLFYREPPRDEEETIDNLKEGIDTLKTELAELEARLALKVKEAADAAKEAEEQANTDKKIEDLEAKAAALIAEATALKNK